MFSTIKNISFTLSLLCSVSAFSQQNNIKIYPYKMDPRKHPDYLRYHIQSPDASLFGNKMQFISLRDLSGADYKQKIQRWVYKDHLGNILWPAYPLIYQDNLKDVVSEIKKQNLYLFDLWGYVPGSGPGGIWQQYKIPDSVLNLFESALGNHWLGMDNGEQDGRYVGGFASQQSPLGADRKSQYFNFQRHFQKMGDELGNKLATLVSLNFGHYFLKEGIYTLIGAETAQGLPNSQIYYSFIRGACKQYGVNWFGNASVWNRWGYKMYGDGATNIDDDYNSGGPLKGTSLSLLKRLMYNHIFYNCVAAGFESSMYVNDAKRNINSIQLSPIGKIQQEAVKWVEKNGDPGTMYTPVAVMTDFFSGWSFPRHLYTSDAYKVWGNLPYQAGDYLMDNVLDIVYPSYQDASYYKDERGFIAPTPYGDITDCLLSDAPLWVLQQYPVLIIGGALQPGVEINDKLENYVKGGGHLVITAGSLKNMSNGIAGIKATGKITNDAGPVVYKGRQIEEAGVYALQELSFPSKTSVIQQRGNTPAAVQLQSGKGQITVIASPFGLTETPQSKLPVKVNEEMPLDKPYPILQHVKILLQDVLSSAQLFEVTRGLSFVTCAKSPTEFNVLVSNPKWTGQDFTIAAKSGAITSMQELKINASEMTAVGYTPKVITEKVKPNNNGNIAGGSVRIFNIKLKNAPVESQPEIQPILNVTGRALTLFNTKDVKEEILSRPTFFAHYDGVVIDWRYLNIREKKIIEEEAGWLNRQKLKITVDLTSGLNLYADLRIVNNDSTQYAKSIQIIKEVIDKMQLLGADQLLLAPHRSIENNIEEEAQEKSLIETLQLLSDYAATKNIQIVMKGSTRRLSGDVSEALNLVKKIGKTNFSYAPSLALLLNNPDNIEENINLLKQAGIKSILISAPKEDIHHQLWSINEPIHSFEKKALIERILNSFPGSHYIMDALYRSYDDEYLDVKMMDEIRE
jgi:hypothetical protein